jgi:predicted nucleic acid-binding protein
MSLGRFVADADTSILAFGTLSEIAAKYGLSVYDAAYLELAKRRGLPLACKDGPLLAAARKARVAIWTEA